MALQSLWAYLILGTSWGTVFSIGMAQSDETEIGVSESDGGQVRIQASSGNPK